jgi:hypothetical protein
MIKATDRWKKPVIKIKGKAITRPLGHITLDDDIETELIRSGLAIAVDGSTVDDSEDLESDDSEDLEELIAADDFDDSEVESSEGSEPSNPSEPVKKTRRVSKK